MTSSAEGPGHAARRWWMGQRPHGAGQTLNRPTDDWLICWLTDWCVMTDTGEGPGHAAKRPRGAGQTLNRPTDDWLICWLTDWFDDWLTDDWLIGWLTDWCVMTDNGEGPRHATGRRWAGQRLRGAGQTLTRLTGDWLICWLTDWLVDWLTGVWWQILEKDCGMQLGDGEQDRDRMVLDKPSPGWLMTDWFVDWLIDWLIDWLVCDGR